MSLFDLTNFTSTAYSQPPNKGVPLMEALIFAIAHLCVAGVYIAVFILVHQS